MKSAKGRNEMADTTLKQYQEQMGEYKKLSDAMRKVIDLHKE